MIQGTASADGKKIFTKGFVELTRARLRGIFKCQTGPKMLSAVVKAYKLEPNYLETEIQSLIQAGELRGTVKGGLYIPTRFLEKKEEIIAKTFEEKGAIEYDWIEKNFLEKKPKELIRRIAKEEVVFLESLAFAKSRL